jgi:sterol desaturase/sphingolipid hydroxylase (fatty acid hydroxylase superfamily)
VFLLGIELFMGLMYANAGEWWVHKYILHGLGKNEGSFWGYHLHDHHNVCNHNNMLDPIYQKLHLTPPNTHSKELFVLLFIVLLHAPILLIFPFFTFTVYGSLGLYYYKHRKAHLDRKWARQHLRWHYDHHLSGKHNANWCITWPWFDYIMGTRVKCKVLD